MGDSSDNGSIILKPLVHFFLLGLVVFGLKAWIEKPDARQADERLIEITSSDVEWFRNLFRKRMGREPFAEELQAQVNQLVRELVLSREAERLGLGNNDDVVRRRLAQKMDYMIRDMAAGVQPTDDELLAYLSRHRQRYEIPGTVAFEQVLFNTEQHGDAGAEQALALFLDNPDLPGDPTMLPRMNENMTPVQVRGVYGEMFADAVHSLEAGKWSGPVKSGYGLHAVYLHQQTAATVPAMDEIRERLAADWLAEKQTEVSNEAYRRLLETYQIFLEGMPYNAKP